MVEHTRKRSKNPLVIKELYKIVRANKKGRNDFWFFEDRGEYVSYCFCCGNTTDIDSGHCLNATVFELPIQHRIRVSSSFAYVHKNCLMNPSRKFYYIGTYETSMETIYEG